MTIQYKERYAQGGITFHSQGVPDNLGTMLAEAGLINGKSYNVRDVMYVPASEVGRGLEGKAKKEPHFLFVVEVNGRDILLHGNFFGERP